MRSHSHVIRWTSPLIVVVALLIARPANAENKLGGHFGFVLPIVSRAGGQTTTIADEFVIGFPMGITVKKNDRLAFDLELVPAIKSHRRVDLTIHPGVIFGLGQGFAAGLRLAFDVKDASFGFTPLLNKAFPIGNDTALFGELVVPVRFQKDALGSDVTSVGLGIHIGVGF